MWDVMVVCMGKGVLYWTRVRGKVNCDVLVRLAQMWLIQGWRKAEESLGVPTAMN